jgi:Cof subfamily protein (haloacid dehalogenase superfamily)
MIPLVVVDLDGTLIGKDAQVKLCVWQAVERATDLGLKVAVCTGRPAFGLALKIAERLGPDNPHVFQGGAHIGYPDGRTLKVTALGETAARAMIAASRKLNVVLEIYTPTNMYVERKTDLSERHAKLIGVTAIVRDLEEVVELEPVIRAQWVVKPALQEKVTAAAPPGATVATATSPGLPNVAFVNVTRGGTSKASAVAYLAERLRVPLRNVMAVGDSENDIAMLEIVGYPRVMANSSAAVLERFTTVVGDVEACGAAEAIDEAVKLRST